MIVNQPDKNYKICQNVPCLNPPGSLSGHCYHIGWPNWSEGTCQGICDNFNILFIIEMGNLKILFLKLKDCSVCAADFKADLAVCGNLSIANLVKCVEDIIKSGKDCEHCVCDIVKIFSKDADC